MSRTVIHFIGPWYLFMLWLNIVHGPFNRELRNGTEGYSVMDFTSISRNNSIQNHFTKFYVFDNPCFGIL